MYRACLLCVAGLATSALAQQAPDAGSLLRQAEPQRVLPQPIAEAAAAPAAPVPATGPTLVVTRFEFEGQQRFTDAELTPLVAGFVARPVTLSELESAAARVAQHYRDADWLARVIVPPQTVDRGIVRLRVIEARLGGARFSNDTDQAALRVRPDDIRAWVLANQAVGEPLQLSAIERGLLLAGDLPGLRLTGSQVAGAGEAMTDVLLNARNSDLLIGNLSADNLGSRATGAERLLARAMIDAPFGLGEQFEVQAQASRGTRYGRLAASLPLGHQGWRLSASVAALDYRLTTAPFAALDARGQSRNTNLGLSYPVIRATDRNLYVSATAESKRLRNRTAAGVGSDYAIRSVDLGFNGNMIDSLGSGGLTTASLALTLGKADLDGSPNQAADAASVATHGHYQVLRYRLARNQTLGPLLTLVAGISGQSTNRNLDSAEKFYLGGPNGVRAYPVNEAGGARGHLINIELQRPIPDFNCTASVFYDHGAITVNPRNGFAGAPSLNHFALRGWGLGLSARTDRLSYSVTLARRIGRNPAAAPDGRDQDGSAARTRLWLNAGISF
jgi:hemolysin activation/secretion protein